MKRRKGAIFVKIICIIAFCGVAFMGFCEAVTEDLSENLVRIHVIANSNGEKDQAVKLKVRDAIIKEANALAGENPLTLSFAEAHLKRLTEATNEVLVREGAAYTCRIETGRFSFPTKIYENITLPQGDYDAVRVVLGEGKGANWWCVMYPPLCFTDSAKGEATKALSDAISPATDAIIQNEHIELKPAFKAVELWQAFKKKINDKCPFV
ncbi:MAG: stage II sporulation protein R [Clostridia bacterium]|nr:stage II sporulation protein R [Clostridia bacterium]